MADRNEQKVGTDPQAAKNFAGKGDFGVHESDRAEREYASRATRNQDPGAPSAHATGEGQRVSGVGSPDSGPGSGSGGDLDPDIIGVGTGSGIAASGRIGVPSGPDDAQPRPGEHGKTKPDEVRAMQPGGTTFDRSGGDVSTSGGGVGAAAVTNPNVDTSDAFAGEISLDESAGADNSPSENLREES